MNDILMARIKRNPPRSQEDCCRLAVRDALARDGAVSGDLMIRTTSCALAMGLFGPAFMESDEYQRKRWVDMMEREYRAAVDASQDVREVQ